jgi:isoquinoline 1-oxidoreductase subunit beta
VISSRRIFSKLCGAKRGAILIGGNRVDHRSLSINATMSRSVSPLFLNEWLRIDADGRLTILIDRAEMGQGVMTSLAMLVAEELDVDLSQVSVEFVTGRPAYRNSLFGVQITAASTSIRLGWLPLRSAGAAARARFIEAAARIWGVDSRSCRTELGAVLSVDGTRRLTYGELAPALRRAPSNPVTLKDRCAFRVIGASTGRLDIKDKITGTAVFGMDVAQPGLLTAVIAKAPELGSKLKSFDAAFARAMPGVKAIVPVNGGVAVAADSFWQAMQARDALQIEWQAPALPLESADIEARFRAAARELSGRVVRADGNFRRAMESAARIVSAEYEVPYQAHAPMEPMNCTADVQPHRCTLWAPTQNPGGAALIAAHICRLPLKAVEVNVTYLGGSFGRRQEIDFIAEAVLISKTVGKPVKVVWTREDEMAHDYYRPIAVCCMEAAIGRERAIIGWRHRIASTSIWKRVASEYAALRFGRWLPTCARPLLARIVAKIVPFGIDPNLAEGATGLPYDIGNILVDYVECDAGVPVGAWSSVGYSYNIFAAESFIDELSAALGKDPYDFRHGLLAKNARLRTVLELVGRITPWHRESRHNAGLGLAVYEYAGTRIAMLAEMAVVKGRGPRVNRIICGVDCGIVVNPDSARAQVEGSIAFGLAATLKHKITFHKNRVVERNFLDYELLRMNEMPAVEVYFVNSDEPPTGLGEAAIPGVAPAVCNALFAATGRRMRKLPLNLTSWVACE